VLGLGLGVRDPLDRVLPRSMALNTPKNWANAFWCIYSRGNVSDGCKRRLISVKRNIKLKKIWVISESTYCRLSVTVQSLIKFYSVSQKTSRHF